MKKRTLDYQFHYVFGVGIQIDKTGVMLVLPFINLFWNF